jgi:hypothetical protein
VRTRRIDTHRVWSRPDALLVGGLACVHSPCVSCVMVSLVIGYIYIGYWVPFDVGVCEGRSRRLPVRSEFIWGRLPAWVGKGSK